MFRCNAVILSFEVSRGAPAYVRVSQGGKVCSGLAFGAGRSNDAAGAAGVAPAGERHGVVQRHG